MNINKKIFQFNDLVFDSIDLINGLNYSQSTKNNLTERTNYHGSYFANKNNDNLYLDVINVNVTIKIDVHRLRCEYKNYYKDYIKSNITKVGRLWAMEGTTLLWAYAIPTSFSEEYSENSEISSIDVEFILYQGFWNIAKLNNIVYTDFDICDFSDCLYLNHDTCADFDDCQYCNCENDETELEACSCCLCREKICLNDEVLKNLQQECDIRYILGYQCDYSDELFWGKKFCVPRRNIGTLYALFHSTTLVVTDNVTIRIKGKFVNPTVTVNDKSIKIKGEYDGMLTIHKNKVYYLKRGCKKEIELPITSWDVVGTGGLGFEAYNGKNTLKVHNEECCDIFCAYVDVQGITI